MRNLTTEQKKLLNQWYEKNKEEIQAGICFFQIDKCDLFPYELLEKLEQINDTEVLVQNINNYISEKGMNAK